MIDKISDHILANDHQILVMNKPAGIPVHPDKTEDTSLLLLAQSYCQRNLHVMTRLDRPVSGVVLMTKTSNAHKSMENNRENDLLLKTYLAIVENGDYASEDRIESYLCKEPRRNKSYVCDDKKGKHAITDYKKIAQFDNYSVLQITTQTGRLHQIRCQLGHKGIFIKGDVKYGARRGNKDRSIDLHAWKLKLKHPTKKNIVEFVAPLPENNILWEEASKIVNN